MIIEVLERVDVKDLPVDEQPLSSGADALLPQAIIKYDSLSQIQKRTYPLSHRSFLFPRKDSNVEMQS